MHSVLVASEMRSALYNVYGHRGHKLGLSHYRNALSLIQCISLSDTRVGFAVLEKYAQPYTLYKSNRTLHLLKGTKLALLG